MSSLGILADYHWLVSCPATTTYLCWLLHSLSPDKENYFVCLLTVAFLSTTMWVFSLPIPHGTHLVIPAYSYFFWVVCHSSRTFPPKEPERKPQNRLSPFPTARPYPLLPLTHYPQLPVLAGYKLVMSGICTCSTPKFILNLSIAYAPAVIWRLVCTFCRSSLTHYSVNYFLTSHSLWPAPFRGWALLDCRLFFLQPILLLLP